MLDFTGILPGYEGVTFKKAKCSGKAKWLYSFRDTAKAACGFDETRVHDDYSVMGSEFCDFLSTLLTFRRLKSFDKCKLLDSMTYGKIMAQLKRAKKIRLDESGWQFIKISPANQLMLQNLGLLPKPEQEEKRRPGRPKKSI